MAFGFEPRTNLELKLMQQTGKSIEELTFEERAEQVQKICVIRKKGLSNIRSAQVKQRASHNKRYRVKRPFEVGDKVYYSNARLKARKGRKLAFKNLRPAFIIAKRGKCTFSILNVTSGQILKNSYHSDKLTLIKKVKPGIAGFWVPWSVKSISKADVNKENLFQLECGDWWGYASYKKIS